MPVLRYKSSFIRNNYWDFGFNFHQYPVRKQDTGLDWLLHNFDRIDKEDIVILLIYLRGAYFGTMNNNQKKIYLDILKKIISKTNGKLKITCMGIASTVLRVTSLNEKICLAELLINEINYLLNEKEEVCKIFIEELENMTRIINSEIRENNQKMIDTISTVSSFQEDRKLNL